MAAIFVNQKSNDVFQTGISYQSPVDVSFLGGLTDPSNITVITSIGCQTSEVFQYFLSFDDLITYFWFGKGVGSLVVQGSCFSGNSGSIPGLTAIANSIKNNRGKTVTVSIDGLGVFQGLITNTSTSIVAEPTTMVEFQLTLSVLASSLQ